MINWIVKIILALFGLVFLLGLLVAFALFIVVASLRWLLSGKKPQFVFFLSQYSAMRKNFGQKGFQGQANPDPQAPWGRGQRPASNDQVVDVEAREVVEDAPQLPDKRRD